MSQVVTQLHILNLLQVSHSYRPDSLKFCKYIKDQFLFSFLKQKLTSGFDSVKYFYISFWVFLWLKYAYSLKKAVTIIRNCAYFWQDRFASWVRFGSLGIILSLTKKTFVLHVIFGLASISEVSAIMMTKFLPATSVGLSKF